MREIKSLWEVLVPTERRSDGKPITTRFHRVWDEKVRAISGGLTIMPPAKGQWIGPAYEGADEQKLFAERMIPVRFIATDEEAEDIVAMTGVYYDQLAILCYEISNKVIYRTLDECEKAMRSKD